MEIVESFLSRVKVDANGCFIWQGYINTNGYGEISRNARLGIRRGGAHRFSYELFRGPISGGLFACHHCDVPACVNPAHLFLGTQKDNMQDASHKGRVPHGSSRHNTTLRDEDILAICDQYSRGASVKKLAKQYSMAVRAIASILAGEAWRHVPRPVVRPRHRGHSGSGNYSARLTEESVRRAREMRSAGALVREVAEFLGVHYATAKNVCLRRTWRHVA